MNAFYLIGNEAHFYELSTLIREFFPLVDVVDHQKEKIPGILISTEGRSATYYGEDGKVIGSYSLEDPFDHYIGEATKNYAKVSIYRVLEAVLGELTPWGILTGVRPTKVAYQYLQEGYSPKETIHILEKAYLLRADKACLCTEVAEREASILQDHEGTDVSLYAGILFCPSRCSYCSFISNDTRALKRYGTAYIDALVKEVLSCRDLIKMRHVRSLYVGGGTPTTLDAASLHKVLGALNDIAPFDQLDEVTVEAGRPDTITLEKLELLKKMGVGRISVNPQTMNQKTLDLIGRHHTVEAIEEAMAFAHDVGFDCINMDLIVGLPGESLEDVAHTLEQIERLRPDNLTIHTLAVKRSSRLNELKEGPGLLSKGLLEAKEVDDMLALCAESARRMGMHPYYMYRQKNMTGNFENVGYSLPGKEGRYNIEIMEERQSILAFGAGGVSKIYEPAINRLTRVPNVKGVKEYIERIDEMIDRKRGGMTP